MESHSELVNAASAMQRVNAYHRRLTENTLYFKLRLAFAEGNVMTAETLYKGFTDSKEQPNINSDSVEEFMLDLIADGEVLIKGLKYLQNLTSKEFHHHQEYFDLCSALKAANAISNQFTYTFANHQPLLSDKGWIHRQILNVQNAAISEANGLYNCHELYNHAGSFQRLGLFEGKSAIFRISRSGTKVWQLAYFFSPEMNMQNMSTWTGIPTRYQITENPLYRCEATEENGLPPLNNWKSVGKAENQDPPTITFYNSIEAESSNPDEKNETNNLEDYFMPE